MNDWSQHDRRAASLRLGVVGVAAGEGVANVWWKSGRVTVKAGAAETGHAFSQIETDDPRGAVLWTPL